MSDAQDLKQLLQQFKRIADAFEGSSASSSSYQVRPGRGGRSNGKVSGDTAYSASAITDAEKELAKIMLRNAKAADGWERAIRSATGITTMFGESAKEELNRIESRNKEQTLSTRKVTQATINLAKQHGVQSHVVKENNAIAFKYNDSMRDLINKHNEMADAEKSRAELTKQIALKQADLAAASGRNAKVKLKNEIDEMKTARDGIKSAEEFNAEIDVLQSEMVKTGQLIKKDVNPAFKELTTGTAAVVDANGDQRLSVEDLNKAYKEVHPLVKAQGSATRQLTLDMGKLSEGVEKGKDAIAASLISLAKGVGSAAMQAVSHFREQLKYNVKDSHYIDAAKMGMSDGELSKVLGENTETFRGITGSADNSKILDGTLQNLQKTVLKLYGESGAAGAQRAAQMAQLTQRSGINVRDNPAVIEQRLKGFSSMADRLGMVKGELVNFAQQLSDSGDMAYLASKYDGMSSADAAAAVDRELEARIANSKMLGLSTEQMKAQIQLERANRYGTMEHMISNIIGAKADANVARKNGVNVTPEIEAAQRRLARGQGQEGDQELVNVFRQDAAAAMERKIGTGSERDAMQQAAYRSVTGKLGGTVHTQEALTQAQTARAIAKGNYTEEEREAYRRNGTLPASFKGDGRDAGDASSFQSAAFGADSQLANTIAQGVEGVVKNPLWSIVGTTTTIMVTLLAMYAKQRALNKLLSGGGKGGRGGPRGGTGPATGPSGSPASRSATMRRLSRVSGVYGNAVTNSKVWQTGGRVAASVMSSPLMSKAANATSATGGALGRAGSAVMSGAAKMGVSNSATRSTARALGRFVGTPLAAVLGGYNGYTDSKAKGESTGNAVSSMVGSAGGAATGALVGGAIGTALIPIPVLGTAIGAAVGGWIGESAGNKIGDGVWDTVTGEGDGPSAKLEATRVEAEKKRLENQTPQAVQIVGPEADAIRSTAITTGSAAEVARQQLGEQKKTNEFKKSKADIRAMLDAQRANIDSTRQRFANLDNS